VGTTAGVAVTILIAGLAGCTSDSGEGTEGRPTRSPTPTSPTPDPATASPSGPGGPTGTAPRTPAAALDLARAVLPLPEDHGDDFVPQDPYETDPATWSVLGEDCAWRREPLPDGVLAGLSRNAEVPADRPGAPPLQVTSSVTVFDSVEAADARMAEILEEALRCPGQELRTGEYVTDLISGAPDPSASTDYDIVYESGQFTTDAHPGAGPYPYLWTVARWDTVTAAVSVKGTEGYDEAAVDDITVNAISQMSVAMEEQLELEAGS
jgi:hypothetical protein